MTQVNKQKKCPKGKERHHIKPKSLGGSNKPRNIVCLTPKQHNRVHSKGPKKGKTPSGRTVRYDPAVKKKKR
jgi:5-methylcytosine-specific restriction endonuclease McrA